MLPFGVMKKPEKTFTLEVGQSALIGIPRESLVTIALRDGKRYCVSIEKLHATLARWHAKENPTGKHRRRLLVHSDQMKNDPRRYATEKPLPDFRPDGLEPTSTLNPDNL